MSCSLSHSVCAVAKPLLAAPDNAASAHKQAEARRRTAIERFSALFTIYRCLARRAASVESAEARQSFRCSPAGPPKAAAVLPIQCCSCSADWPCPCSHHSGDSEISSSLNPSVLLSVPSVDTVAVVAAVTNLSAEGTDRHLRAYSRPVSVPSTTCLDRACTKAAQIWICTPWALVPPAQIWGCSAWAGHAENRKEKKKGRACTQAAQMHTAAPALALAAALSATWAPCRAVVACSKAFPGQQLPTTVPNLQTRRQSGLVQGQLRSGQAAGCCNGT